MTLVLPLLALGALALLAPKRAAARPADKPADKKAPVEVRKASDAAQVLRAALQPQTAQRAKKAIRTYARALRAAKVSRARKAAVPVRRAKVISPAAAATGLRAYLVRTGDFGTREHPSFAVENAQRAMGGGLTADGIVGPKTAARALVLGVVLPPRLGAPVRTLTAVPAPKKPAEPTARKALPAPAPAPTPARAEPSPLADAARAALAAVVAAAKGAGGKVPAVQLTAVRAFQAAEGQLGADGRYGPNTRAALAHYLAADPARLPAVPAAYSRTRAGKPIEVTWKPPTAAAA